VPIKVITTLSDEEIFSILHTFTQGSNSEIRNQTIFMLLIDTGIRIGELINIKMPELNLADGLVKVTGKGKKERVVPLGSQVQRELQSYLFRHRSNPANQGIENVFLS
jgi:integrase/recombinase XerD